MAIRGLILFLISPFGSSLSLKANLGHPPDPCPYRAKQCPLDKENAQLASLAEVGCPWYDEGVFDGMVCVGCFRDDYEINNWDVMSFAEKAYALEDASERSKSIELLGREQREGIQDVSISTQDLKSQSALWMAMAKAEQSVQPNDDDPNYFTENPKVNEQTDSARKTEVVVASIETNSATAATMASAESFELQNINDSMTKTQDEESPRLYYQEEEQVQQNLEDKPPQQSSQPPPPTPCTRICRYNADCYDGKVCIGCFRDTHDIAHWSSMSPLEKMFSLEDAADRCKDLSEKDGKDTDSCFEGGITETALREQASQWGAWNGQ